MSDNLLVDLNQKVLTLTLNRPERKNALNTQMYEAISSNLGQALRDPQVHVAVIQASESVFCAGNDLGDFLQGRLPGPQSPGAVFLEALIGFDKPLIAAVCGPCVGVGATMLFHCDLVYCGDNAVFSFPFVNLGLCPEAGSSLLAPLLFGYQRAAQALLLADPLGAEDAKELGLVSRIVPPAECNALANTQARRLALKPLTSLMATKRLLKGPVRAQLANSIAAEGAALAKLFAAPEAREAMSAFLEKRAPDFSKR